MGSLVLIALQRLANAVLKKKAICWNAILFRSDQREVVAQINNVGVLQTSSGEKFLAFWFRRLRVAAVYETGGLLFIRTFCSSNYRTSGFARRAEFGIRAFALHLRAARLAIYESERGGYRFRDYVCI